MPADLKPCPCCGSSATFASYVGSGWGHVTCTVCDLRTGGTVAREYAEAFWNRRIAEDIDVALTEARRVLAMIAHTFVEDSHGGDKTLPASDYQQMARDALKPLEPDK